MLIPTPDRPLPTERAQRPGSSEPPPRQRGHLPEPFLTAARELASALQPRVHPDHLAQRRQLAAWFERPEGPIDYDSYADAFAVSYLLSNYWKAAHAMQRAAPGNRSNIVDLGAGSGAAACAALAWIASASGRPDRINLHLVDRSRRSLSLARELSRRVVASLPQLHATRIHSWHTDLRTHALPGDSLVLLSHVLTEHRPHLSSVLSPLREQQDHDVLIVERQDDDVWADIDQVVGGCDWSRACDQFHLDWAVEELLPDQHEPSPGLRSRWMLLTRRERTTEQAVAGYFDAWRKQSPEHVRELFTPDAKYVYHPFQPPLRGRDEIEHYWHTKVLTQRNPTIEMRPLAYGPTQATVEWTTHFERDASAVTVRGTIIFEIDPHSRRIAELREYYHSTRAPLGAADDATA